MSRARTVEREAVPSTPITPVPRPRRADLRPKLRTRLDGHASILGPPPRARAHLVGRRGQNFLWRGRAGVPSLAGLLAHQAFRLRLGCVRCYVLPRSADERITTSHRA